MIVAHNGDTSRVITGSSTHNECIEWLWHDVHRSVTTGYADTFHSLEAEGILDALNEVDLYCFHNVYTYHEYAKTSQSFRSLGTTTNFQQRAVKLLINCFLKGLSMTLGIPQNFLVLK